MATRTIYLANLSELLYSTYNRNKNRDTIQKIIQSDGDRTFFYGDHNKLIVTSTVLDQALINDSLSLLNYQNTTTLNSKNPSYSLSSDLFKDKKLREALLKWLEGFKGRVDLIPYGTTEEFYHLISWFKKKLPRLIINCPETPNIDNLVVRDYLDSKAGFRSIWDRFTGKDDIKTPFGYHCPSWQEVLKAGKYFYRQKHNFLLKLNYGVAGWGIEKFLVKQYSDVTGLIAAMEKRCADKLVWWQGIVVAEQYIAADDKKLGGSPSIEYKIISRNGRSILKYQYFCQQVLTEQGNFLGILINNSLVKNKLFQKIRESSEVFGRGILQMGYVGTFDVDFIIGKKDDVYALESNTRRTGGTHTWELANYLLKDKLDQYLIFSNDAYKINKSVKNYSELKGCLQDLFWGKFRKDEGLIISGTSMLHFNKFGYIIFVKQQRSLVKINQLIKQRLT